MMTAWVWLRLLLTAIALSAPGRGGGVNPAASDDTEEEPPPPSIAPPHPTLKADKMGYGAAAIAVLAVLASALAAVLWLWRQADPSGPPPVLRGDNAPLAFALLALSGWVVYLLWRVPQWQAAAWAERAGADPREQFEIENASRATLGQILSGVAVLAGLVFAWQQLGSTSRSVGLTEESLQVSQEGQITDRFSKAVEQLGSDNLSVRLGGVYALERIAR
ncbi:MAG: hypothetical protein IT337_02780, partial [Thermomicrobiales bacterium]|nr:hypothetical protein [Thermomicrobiales bacterium]